MTFKDGVRWNVRMSAVYALGVWTMIGSYAFFKYTGRWEGLPVKTEEEKEKEEEEDPNRVVYKTEHTKSVIVYKKDFVPYTTRLYNLIKPYMGDSGGGDGDK
ncbi:small integral membrane protein 26-like [Parambassis ranga]|uniref:Small integral membrane protein 26 n=1 Tax=Parambassis ranga TaxID=210632 RepID=A0A6P7J7Z6_9TELE|nr:small integral membrane protein 26 [Parambassis ranga]XP_028272894.1 small integral membrane protein 26 [Parambassis ranga]